MKTNQPEDLIPEHKEGAKTNTESDAEFKSETEASRFYQMVRERLLDVNHWNKWAGEATARFQLRDAAGNKVNRLAQQGDYFQIDIPGPDGEKEDDWVRIEAIEEGEEGGGQMTAIRVRPAENPLSSKGETAHFFDAAATSTFVAKREGCKVIAGVYGRNEKPNTERENLGDKIRNAVVALGAMLGFSKLQWKSLVTGLVSKDPA
ncbi:MAG: hypothetical protein INR73_01780 [Williamsia sp.]|nr:hypothetical protein [Williamsia sp.]